MEFKDALYKLNPDTLMIRTLHYKTDFACPILLGVLIQNLHDQKKQARMIVDFGSVFFVLLTTVICNM
jgi:hypothetical protein